MKVINEKGAALITVIIAIVFMLLFILILFTYLTNELKGHYLLEKQMINRYETEAIIEEKIGMIFHHLNEELLMDSNGNVSPSTIDLTPFESPCEFDKDVITFITAGDAMVNNINFGDILDNHEIEITCGTLNPDGIMENTISANIEFSFNFFENKVWGYSIQQWSTND